MLVVPNVAAALQPVLLAPGREMAASEPAASDAGQAGADSLTGQVPVQAGSVTAPGAAMAAVPIAASAVPPDSEMPERTALREDKVSPASPARPQRTIREAEPPVVERAQPMTAEAMATGTEGIAWAKDAHPREAHETKPSGKRPEPLETLAVVTVSTATQPSRSALTAPANSHQNLAFSVDTAPQAVAAAPARESGHWGGAAIPDDAAGVQNARPSDAGVPLPAEMPIDDTMAIPVSAPVVEPGKTGATTTVAKTADAAAGVATAVAEDPAAEETPVASAAVVISPTPVDAGTTAAKPSRLAEKLKAAMTSAMKETGAASGPPMRVQGEAQAQLQSTMPRPATKADAPAEGKVAGEKKTSALSTREASVGADAAPAPSADTGTQIAVPHESVPASPQPTRPVDAHSTALPASLPEMPAAPKGPGIQVASDGAGDMQMHVGIRTTAFGAVEIYTSVHQNEVGLAVRGERGMEHWLGAEMPSLEAGLKDHHLHLTSMELDRGGTGMQTSTGSHQQQPGRQPMTARAWLPARTDTAAVPFEIARASPLAVMSESRVSIHV